MIWQLMRRDASWRFAISWVVVGALGGFFARGNASGFITILVQLVVLYGAARPTERATQFHAALPLLARDVVLARLYAALSAIWLPSSVAIIASAVAHKQPVLGACIAIEALGLSVVTCMTLLLRPRTLETGALLSNVGGLLVLLFSLPAFALYAFDPITYHFDPWRGTYSIVLAVFLFNAIIVTLCIVRTRFIPRSFQYAPLRSKRAWPRLKIRHSSRVRHPWLSLFRTVFNSPGSLFGWFVAGQLSSWAWWIAPIIAGAMVATTLKRTTWLLTLPIRRARILTYILGAGLIVALPWAFGIIAVVSRQASPLVTALVVRRTCGMALLFLVLANIVLLWWNRSVRKRLGDYLGLAFWGGLIMFVVINKLNSSFWKLDPGRIIQGVDALLSSYLGIVSVGSAALSVLLWRSAQRLFAVAEVHNPVAVEGKFVEMWAEV